jgi:hypothetical protein
VTATTTSDVGVGTGDLSSGREEGAGLGPWVVLGLLLAAMTAELMYLSRGLYFNFDEWDFVLFRHGHSAAVFLTPHNEHVSLVPIAIFKALFKVFGIGHYWPYLLTNVLIVQACALLVYLYARPRIGAWAALVPVVLIGFMGAAATDLFWPFEMSLELPVLCGVAILLLFDHRPRFADPLACLLTTIAVFSSGAGLVILVGVIVEIAARQDRVRRAWIAGVPLVLYAAWWLGYHAKTQLLDHVPYVPAYDVNASAATAGALVGLDIDWGRLLAVALVVAVVLTFMRRRDFPTRLTTLCVMAVAYWTLIALLRGAEAVAAESRYMFVGGVLVTLVVIELLAGRVPAPTRVALGVAGVLTFAVALSGLQQMRAVLPFFHQKVDVMLPELTAVEMDRATLPPDMALDQTLVPGGTVKNYLDAVASYGSPALSEAGLAKASPDGRKGADAIFVAGAQPQLAERNTPFAAAGAATRLTGSTGATVSSSGSCVRVTAKQPGATVSVLAPRGGVVITPFRGPVQVGLRRFADESTAIGQVGPGRHARLRLTADRIRRPWTVTLTTSGAATVCSAG